MSCYVFCVMCTLVLFITATQVDAGSGYGGSKLIVSTRGQPISTPASRQQCGIPVNVTGVPVNIQEVIGKWYEYMFRGPFTDLNPNHTYTSIGPVMTPDGLGIAINWTATYFPTDGQNGPRCAGMYSQANISSSGKKYALTYFDGADLPSAATYTILYSDPNALELAYNCGSTNDANGMCSNPYFFILTRRIRTDMDMMTRTYIDNAINFALGPYCLSVRDMQLSNWNLNLPPCNPTQPAGFPRLVAQAG